MAENQKVIKIKELPDITNIEDTDILVIEDRNTTRKASAQDIVGYIKNHKAISDYYVQQSTVDAANGLAALNADKKIKSENIPFGNTVNTVFEGSSGKALESSLDAHILDKDNPHGTTKQQIGLSNVDNTSDRNKPVSTAQQAAIDLAYQNATGYADRVKSDIMGGIPESTLDTIVELGEALKDSEDALTTLIETVGTKAPQTELDSHASNNVIHVTPANKSNWTDAYNKRHEHSNKTVLDGITTALITAWNNAVTHISDTVRHITAAERTDWNDANSKKHTHSNKSVLDGITSTLVTAWNRAKTHADSAHAPSNAQANQNAFSKIAVGSTTVEADNATDTLTLAAGSNITITPDATNDKLTITAKDTVYTHPSNTAYSNGLYKVTVDALGHVTSAVAVSKADITGLGIPSADTNTHYASKNVVGSSTATSNTTTALTNGNVYLLSVENGVVTSAHQIKGTGGCTVTTDASGNILINGANTYTLPTATGSVLGGVKTGANITNTSGVISLTKANVISALGYTPGTSSADPITVDSELSATSANPVENKAVYAALEDKSHFSSAPANGQVVVADGTAGAIKTSGYTIAASVPSGAKFTDTVYTHPATAGNKHIPGGGSSGQILRWSSAGTAAWGADNNSDTKNTAGSTNTSSKLFLVGATSQAANPQTYSHDTAYVGEDGCLYSNNKKVSVDGHTHPYAGSGSAGGAATTALACTGNSATATKWATPRNVNGLSMDGTSNLVNYTSCSTAAGTAAKAVSCTGFALITGAEITVKFTATNTAGSPTLNVNNTGAKPIYYRGSAISAGYLAANRTYTFRYNGTQYDLVGDINIDTNNAVTQTISNTANANYRILFSNTADDATRTEGTRKDTNLTYNPSTNTLNVVNVNGTASKAIGDANGNTIINEIVSDTEPANQKAGDFWLKEY